MRIDGPGRTTAAGAGGQVRGGPSGTAFRLPDGQPAARPVTVSTPGGVYDVAALMALQSVPVAPERRRRAVRRGFEMLDALEAIRIDLLSGDLPDARLESLVGLLATAEPTDAPSLDARVGAIELRARVELAKRGRFPG